MLGLDFLSTRVARRVLASFVVGAVLPVALLGGLSFVTVTDQLEEQSNDRLKQLSKNAGMSIMERLLLAEAGLRRLAAVAATTGGDGLTLAVPPPSMDRVVLWTPDGTRPLTGSGDSTAVPSLEAGDREHLDAGRPLLLLDEDPRESRYWMAVGGAAGQSVLWGRLVGDSLWASAEQSVQLPTVSTFCVLDPALDPLHCSPGDGGAIRTALMAAEVPDSRLLRWEEDGEQYLAGFWKLFLPGRYRGTAWTIVVSESEAAVYAPIESFAVTFPLVLLLGVSVVLLLANVQVRRTMEPLEKLTEGTRRIGTHDLSTRVEVDRADEFGVLADSFNLMAGRLSLQFRQLEAGRAIDRAVLTAMDKDAVVEAVMDGVMAVVPSGRAAMVLLESGAGGRGTLHGRGGPGGTLTEEVAVPVTERAWMGRESQPGFDGDVPPLLRAAGFTDADRPLLVLPLRVQGQVRGALALGSRDGIPVDEETLAGARQLVDQASVALDEVRLLQELEDMSWGTLRALARAIDAKSRWTAGHSERVVELALELAREMDVGEADLEILHRGGLLHDLGKIGVSQEVLDFPGPLTPKARKQMEEHTVIGARILEPVRAFEPVLPIVLSHHERWDGRGYPHQLRGREIHRLARILAVADNFDALTSPRPYREPLAHDVVVEHIVSESGTAFDPEVVVAFRRVVDRGWRTSYEAEEVGAHG